MSFTRRVIIYIFFLILPLLPSCAHLLPYSDDGELKGVLVSELKQDSCKDRPKELAAIINTKNYQATSKHSKAIYCHGFSFYEVLNTKDKTIYNLYERISSNKDCVRQIAIPITHGCSALNANDCPELNKIKKEQIEFLDEVLESKSLVTKSDLYDYDSFEKWCRKRVRQNIYLKSN